LSCPAAGLPPLRPGMHPHCNIMCMCRLADEEGVRSIVCLQEDSDMAWFDLDVAPIQVAPCPPAAPARPQAHRATPAMHGSAAWHVLVGLLTRRLR